MTTKEALELMANVCKLGDIIDRQKIDLQSATLRAERAEADLAAAREDVARLDKALTNTKAAIYGEHGKPSLLGHGHNARYDCGFIANWHSDPNCKIEETARHAEALLLEVHQMTVKVAQEVEAAIDSDRAGGGL